ncbi:MAG: hypothetical protein ACJAV3_002292, partial [Alcanivorax sp.]
WLRPLPFSLAAQAIGYEETVGAGSGGML